MDKEETILYLRHLKDEGYIFSDFNLNHVLDFIDELQEQRNNLLKRLDKEQSIRKEAIEYCNENIIICKNEQSTDEWECCIDELKGVLSILDKESK